MNHLNPKKNYLCSTVFCFLFCPHRFEFFTLLQLPQLACTSGPAQFPSRFGSLHQGWPLQVHQQYPPFSASLHPSSSASLPSVLSILPSQPPQVPSWFPWEDTVPSYHRPPFCASPQCRTATLTAPQEGPVSREAYGRQDDRRLPWR